MKKVLFVFFNSSYFVDDISTDMLEKKSREETEPDLEVEEDIMIS